MVCSSVLNRERRCAQITSRAAAVCLLALAIPIGATAEVSGAFKVGATTIAPKYAGAYLTRDTRDSRKKQVEVVLSEHPIDAAAAALALDPHTQAINQDGLREGNYILLWIDAEGRATMNATFSETMTQYLAMRSDLRAELTENTTTRVAGRVFTPEPVKTIDGEVYEVDVAFAVDVAAGPAGTPLPVDGGDPGRAFEALYAAVTEKNADGIRAGLSQALRERLEEDYRTPEENLEYVLDILQIWLPKSTSVVTGGELLGDAAVLEVEGEMFPGQKALYLVKMVKEGDFWRFDEATNAGLL